MNLPDIHKYLEYDDLLEMKDIQKLLRQERLLTINSVISFIKGIQNSIANEDDKRVINKLLLNIIDEFKKD